MRLTQLLRVSFPKNRGVPGLTYAGRNQKYKPIKTSAKDDAVNMVMMTEQNMMYLNRPYLLKSEEDIYGLNNPGRKLRRYQEFIREKKRTNRFWTDSRLEDHFKSLNRNKKWE